MGSELTACTTRRIIWRRIKWDIRILYQVGSTEVAQGRELIFTGENLSRSALRTPDKNHIPDSSNLGSSSPHYWPAKLHCTPLYNLGMLLYPSHSGNRILQRKKQRYCLASRNKKETPWGQHNPAPSGSNFWYRRRRWRVPDRE